MAKTELHADLQMKMIKFLIKMPVTFQQAIFFLWKIYKFPIHQKYPPVEKKISFHRPGQETVLFQANEVQAIF